MNRPAALSLALPLALPLALLVLPALAEADDAKTANCAATGEIVRLAVEERSGARSRDETIAFLTSDKAGIDDKYDTTIPALVEWVWSLDEAVLQDDVAGTFEAGCLAYEG